MASKIKTDSINFAFVKTFNLNNKNGYFNRMKQMNENKKVFQRH